MDLAIIINALVYIYLVTQTIWLICILALMKPKETMEIKTAVLTIIPIVSSVILIARSKELYTLACKYYPRLKFL